MDYIGSRPLWAGNPHRRRRLDSNSNAADTRIGHLRGRKADPANITSVSIDRSAAFIKGVGQHLPNARTTFDKFDVIALASDAVTTMRTIERTDPALTGLRWTLLKDRAKVIRVQTADLDRLVAQFTTKRTAPVRLYREQRRDVLGRKQINVVSTMPAQWCTNVMRSKIEPKKKVAALVRSHFDGIVACSQTRQTNGFLEAINGLFQAAKRKARSDTRLATMRTVIFLVAGKLKFAATDPHVA